MINGHDKEATKIVVSDRDGKVVWQFSKPTENLVLEPQNAYEIAEATARAAHTARFGTKPETDGSYIAQQVRARITEQMRDRMIVRAKLMMRSMVRQERDPDYIARQVVDAIFSEVA